MDDEWAEDDQPKVRMLIVTAHWSDELGAIDAACKVMKPLKANGTEGWAAAYDLETGQELLKALTDTGESSIPSE